MVCGHVEHANKLQVASDLYFLILKSIKTISTSVVFSLLTFIVPVRGLHTKGREVAQRGWEWSAWRNGRGLCRQVGGACVAARLSLQDGCS